MRWLQLLNLTLAVLIVGLLVCFFCLLSPELDPPLPAVPLYQKELPKSPFADVSEKGVGIADGPFRLSWVPPQIQLPDLRQELLFYGKNGRPDSSPGKSSFHLTLTRANESRLIQEGEKNYLVYQGRAFLSPVPQASSLTDPRLTAAHPIWGEVQVREEETPLYTFSPGNQPTPLWFEVKGVSEDRVEVRIGMLDEKGCLVISPPALRTFYASLQEGPRMQLPGWEIDGYRVDTTLLTRQKVRWYGVDVFLEKHGGSEFAYAKGKERIDFCDGTTPYSCFVAPGDFLIWKERRWKVAGEIDETQRYPLLVVKKIEDKIISFELWSPEGRGKMLLNLLRTKDRSALPNLTQELKFIGAKTWAQFIIECRLGRRLILKPHDWLVLGQEGWQKLETAEEIDAYVEQVITGPLFILEKMTKQNGKQVLVGHLFNASRTEVEEVELPSSSPAPLANFYRHLPVNPPLQSSAKATMIEFDGSDE